MGCRSRATWKTFLRGYLRCGILSFGLASARCGTCGHDFLVARRWATTKSVQGSRCLPLMQRPPHGADRRPSGRSRHPTGCRPTVGDFRAEEAALTLGGCAHPWRLRSPLAAALTLGGCGGFWRRGTGPRPSPPSRTSSCAKWNGSCARPQAWRRHRPLATRPASAPSPSCTEKGSALERHVHLHVCVTDGVFSRTATGDQAETGVTFPAGTAHHPRRPRHPHHASAKAAHSVVPAGESARRGGHGRHAHVGAQWVFHRRFACGSPSTTARSESATPFRGTSAGSGSGPAATRRRRVLMRRASSTSRRTIF